MLYLRIKEILREKNKTKYWFIKNMAGSYQSLSKIMNNETRSIHFDTLEKICTVLDCEPNDLIAKK